MGALSAFGFMLSVIVTIAVAAFGYYYFKMGGNKISLVDLREFQELDDDMKTFYKTYVIPKIIDDSMKKVNPLLEKMKVKELITTKTYEIQKQLDTTISFASQLPTVGTVGKVQIEEEEIEEAIPETATATPTTATATPSTATATPSTQTATPATQTATPATQTATPSTQTATPATQTATTTVTKEGFIDYPKRQIQPPVSGTSQIQPYAAVLKEGFYNL